MNIMRKLRGVGGANAASGQDEANSNPQHTALGLMHLKKLFSEYTHPSHPLTEKEKDDKLYNMLPLFCKVFGNSPCSDMVEKFRDMSAFCQQVSKLMVSEIRRRASNQSTEAASCAIAHFLEIEGSEEVSNGWMLLSTLNLLAAAGDPALIQVMTSVSLPSTLVKCLYLFFDLPEMTEPDNSQTGSEFTPRERRILLQKIFVQVLVRLCSHASPAEELSRKDDLTLLFSAITSGCPQYNVMWRKSAAEVLMTISRHGLTQPVVSYIHSKGCVALCIDNMQRGQELSPLEIVEMFVAVFCFLKDSSEVSQTLLDDFRSCQGYGFLSDFLLKLEQDKSQEAGEAIRNLVLMVVSLCMCGYVELKPSAASMGSLFQMMGFTLPQPQGRGAYLGGSVRNIQAFKVLQTVFIKSNCPVLCCTILDAISSVYHSDNANYFILENQHTLPQFAEKIHHKTPEIQEKFFQLLEFIVFQLNFVPCKELISLSILLKSQNSVSCSIVCMQTLLNIVKHNAIFKDVYREVGILEVFVTCLQRYANILKLKQQAAENGNEYIIRTDDEQLAALVMNCLSVLLSGNANNGTVFRECGGSKCVHGLVQYMDSRHQALGIIRELILTSGGEDDMATLLGMMHSAPPSSLTLKSHILKSLLMCLRESHRTRTVFRKVGGFVYVMSVLVSMEGCLKDTPAPPWDSVPLSQILSLLHTVFNTITVAMRFEPANAKFFHLEICMTSLCDTLRLLGCFSLRTEIDDSEGSCTSSKDEELFHSIFTGNVLEPTIPENIPLQLAYACIVMKMLYNIALDAYDKPNQNVVSFKSPSHRRQNIESQRSLESPSSGRRINSLNLTPPAPDPVIVHSGVVVAMLQLIPSIQDLEETQQSLTLQVYMTEVVKSLVRSERNQQVMCDTGQPSHLLVVGHKALEQETHPLHPPLQYMLERLATQSVEPKDLREFLRLGDPLCCLAMDSLFLCHNRNAGGPVPLTRVKTLVSMTTPRSQAQGSAPHPPFVELDMGAEGFGCLYLPSVAPQSPTGPSVVNVATLTAPDTNVVGGIGSAPQSPTGPSVVNVATLTAPDINVVGGIGSGDRMFPPQTGLSYSTWICVERFSDPRSDPHCVRLLTLVRNLHSARDDHLICLAVVLSARDKAIIITTQETPLSHTSADWEPEGGGDSCARVWCPDLLQEGQWHHIVLVLNRAVLKNSSFSIYVDSQLITTQKLHYISQNPGGGAANLTVASSVYGYIGTPPQWRRYSRLCWKQGPCHLLEEVLSPHIISAIYQRGPHYLGSLQATQVNGLPALVAEEKVVFGLNAKAVTHLTLAKIRKVYSRVDNKSIAKQLGMSSHENATPIRVLHNSAGHLSGPARSLGGVVVGYLGVRVFTPKPVTKMIENVGGCSVLLGLIAMAQDVESLYAGVKALVCVVRGNRSVQQEMDRRRGYQTLAMLLRKKRALLNSHILHLAFSLVGTVDSGRESSSIPHPVSFQDLLCDLEVWHGAPGELQRSLLEHLYELVTESSEKRHNLNTMREMQLVGRLLRVLPEVTSPATRQVLLGLLGAVLAGQPLAQDLQAFGQFITATLPSNAVSERDIVLQECSPRSRQPSMELSEVDVPPDTANWILLRNRCLQLLHSLLFTPRNTVNTAFCEEVVSVLGMDWPLLFMQGHLHPSTVVWGLRVLVVLASIPSLLTKFREGSSNGGWLQDTELVLHNKLGVVLGYQLGTAVPKSQPQVHSEALCVPGFQHLAYLLTQHIDIAQVYFLLMALMMGQPVKLLPADPKLDLDNVWNFMFGIPASQSVTALSGRVTLCPQAVTVLLSMVHTMLSQDYKSPESLPEWLRDYPVTIIQFLFFLYHNMAELMPVLMSAEVLNALAQTLFPPPHSQVSTPADETFSLDGTIVRSPSKDNMLNNHPARRFVMDFLRVIVVDSLSLPVNAKVTPAIDLVLEAAPEGSTVSQQARFQTEVLSTLMEHLLAADVLIGEQAALPVVAGGNAANITPNVCYLTARIVDKLWQGMLLKDPHEVLDFILKLIAQAKRRPASVPLEGLYHCLNRTILFLLSRGTDSIADQMPVLETLHKLTNHRGLVFGAGNHELDFIGCLTYCLLQLTSDQKIMLDSNAKTTWHVNPNEDSEELTAKQGHNLMAVAAKRVWDELYVSKKPAIEEVFKMTLSNSKAPELSAVREHIQEAATKLWLNYVESERKASYRNPWELHNQIQSKIQKVTGGLTRLASRTKVKKEETVKIRPQLTGPEIEACTLIHVALVKELVELQIKTYIQSQQHMQRYILEEWLQTETELTRERGLWGPETPSRLDKWMLDMTEGPSRMRKKMKKNDLFYLHYPYRPELDCGDNKSLKYKVASSWDSKEWYHKYRPTCLLDREFVPEPTPDSASSHSVVHDLDHDDTAVVAAGIQDMSSALRRAVKRSVSEPEDAGDETEGESGANEEDSVPDNQSILRRLEENEKISHMFRCARIQGLDTVEGLLLFGKEHLYVVDGFTLLKTREIRDIESLPPECHEPILPSSGAPRQSATKKQCSKFAYDDIREVHKRRYLLQPMALEVFSGDGRNYLLAFPRKVRNKVYQRFMAFATGIADSAQQSVAGQKRTANVEQGAGLLSNLIGDTSVTQRWVRGEISNFQYLMHLNTLAGRSYNDLMQYPVFPWILADYDSDQLDLSLASTFRDFSKPMGAQSPDRLDQFKKRYKEWDDPHGETPPYHYGTHYSSAMIVCSYLVRMEPFTQHFLRLQGGHFDLADRMFNSVREAWLSASRHNMADVKELIPEFFYLPEFLGNANNFDLGCKQNGVQLGDVVLPPWAKEDPREFIRGHRAALECDYVSQHLHEWIDLIFGYKQQGQAAEESVNLFHHLFYEGNVDIYSIDDPLKKNATIGFINNFGQIPKQLFKKPHPAKRLGQRSSMLDMHANPLASPLPPAERLFYHNLDNLRPSLQPIKELKGPVGQILQYEKTVQAVEQNKVLVPPTYARYVAWGFADHSLRIGSYDSDKAAMVCEEVMQGSGEVVACVCPSSKTIVTAGTSSVVTMWEYSHKQLQVLQCLYGHNDAVTCLACSPAYNVIVSGSRDATAIVWDLSRRIFVRQLRNHAAPIAAVAVNDLTGDIATCAGTWLHLWSINGDELACVNTCVGRADRMQQILCVAFSQCREWDSQNVVMTGSTDGVVRMWSVEYVQVPKEESSSPPQEEEKEREKEKKEVAEGEEEGPKQQVHKQMVKQMSISAEFTTTEEGKLVAKSGSESSLSEDGNENKKKKEKRKKSKKEPDVQSEEKEMCSDEDKEQTTAPVVRRRRSSTRTNPQFRKSECAPARPLGLVEREGKDDTGGLRPSKSDTSLTDSFVVVTVDGEAKEEEPAPVPPLRRNRVNNHHTLRQGFVWQRQLVFRSKLTMHTAYDRKDNAEPASITALAVSRDHRTVYVGDTRGRVFSWSVSDQPGRGVADHWLKDEGAEGCANCNVRFSIYERRHHCRNCGNVFCSKCSRFESEISRLRILKPVRVCQGCHASLRTSNKDS